MSPRVMVAQNWVCFAVCFLSGLLLPFGCSPSTPSAPSPASAQPSAPLQNTTGTQRPFAFVTNSASDFWKIAEVGVRKAEAELGVKVLFRIPSAATAEQQQQILQDLIASGVAGIAISPKDPANQVQMLNEAARYVPLITHDSDAPESNRLCYIGTNNYEAGKEAGKLVQECLPNGGKILVCVGTLDAQNARDRYNGLRDQLSTSGHEIVGVRTDDTDRARAVANVEDAVVSIPDLACIVGLWSYNGPAILNGVTSTGKLDKIKIVCFDEEDETLQGIAEGKIYGTIVQQPYEFGYRAIRLLKELAEGNTSSIPPSKQIYIPVQRVTKENVHEFWAELKRLTGKA